MRCFPGHQTERVLAPASSPLSGLGLWSLAWSVPLSSAQYFWMVVGGGDAGRGLHSGFSSFLQTVHTQGTTSGNLCAVGGKISLPALLTPSFACLFQSVDPRAQALEILGWNGSGLHGGQKPCLVHLQGNTPCLAQSLGHGNCSINPCLTAWLKTQSPISRSSQFSTGRQMDI